MTLEKTPSICLHSGGWERVDNSAYKIQPFFACRLCGYISFGVEGYDAMNVDHSKDVLWNGAYWPRSQCCGRAELFIVVATPEDGDWIVCKHCGYQVRRAFESPPTDSGPYLI